MSLLSVCEHASVTAVDGDGCDSGGRLYASFLYSLGKYILSSLTSMLVGIGQCGTRKLCLMAPPQQDHQIRGHWHDQHGQAVTGVGGAQVQRLNVAIACLNTHLPITSSDQHT